MNLLLHIAAACGFLFLFFLAADYTDENSAFVYLEYMCLAMVFFLLIHGVAEYLDLSSPKKTRSTREQENYRESLKNLWGKYRRRR